MKLIFVILCIWCCSSLFFSEYAYNPYGMTLESLVFLQNHNYHRWQKLLGNCLSVFKEDPYGKITVYIPNRNTGPDYQIQIKIHTSFTTTRIKMYESFPDNSEFRCSHLRKFSPRIEIIDSWRSEQATYLGKPVFSLLGIQMKTIPKPVFYQTPSLSSLVSAIFNSEFSVSIMESIQQITSNTPQYSPYRTKSFEPDKPALVMVWTPLDWEVDGNRLPSMIMKGSSSNQDGLILSFAIIQDQASLKVNLYVTERKTSSKNLILNFVETDMKVEHFGQDSLPAGVNIKETETSKDTNTKFTFQGAVTFSPNLSVYRSEPSNVFSDIFEQILQDFLLDQPDFINTGTKNHAFDDILNIFHTKVKRKNGLIPAAPANAHYFSLTDYVANLDNQFAVYPFSIAMFDNNNILSFDFKFKKYIQTMFPCYDYVPQNFLVEIVDQHFKSDNNLQPPILPSPDFHFPTEFHKSTANEWIFRNTVIKTSENIFKKTLNNQCSIYDLGTGAFIKKSSSIQLNNENSGPIAKPEYFFVFPMLYPMDNWKITATDLSSALEESKVILPNHVLVSFLNYDEKSTTASHLKIFWYKRNQIDISIERPLDYSSSSSDLSSKSFITTERVDLHTVDVIRTTDSKIVIVHRVNGTSLIHQQIVNVQNFPPFRQSDILRMPSADESFNYAINAQVDMTYRVKMSVISSLLNLKYSAIGGDEYSPWDLSSMAISSSVGIPTKSVPNRLLFSDEMEYIDSQYIRTSVSTAASVALMGVIAFYLIAKWSNDASGEGLMMFVLSRTKQRMGSKIVDPDRFEDESHFESIEIDQILKMVDCDARIRDTSKENKSSSSCSYESDISDTEYDDMDFHGA